MHKHGRTRLLATTLLTVSLAAACIAEVDYEEENAARGTSAAPGTQAAVLEQAFAAPDLKSCVPPQEKDIVAPVQPFPAEAMPASTLTVGSGGTYSSLSQALAAAKDGDGILVKGSVSGSVSINKRVVVTGQGATLSGNVTLGAGATLQGFDIKASGGTAITIAGDNCKVLNNKITGHSRSGVAISGNKGTLVAGNNMTGLTSCAQGKDCGERGVSISNGNGTVVADNLFYHNSYGVIIDGCTGCAIFRNKFDKNTEIEFYVEGLSKTTIRGNRIEYSGYTPGNSAIGVDGFGMRDSKDTVIDRNFVSSHYYGFKVYLSSQITFSNNVSDESGVPVRFGHSNGSPEGTGPDILVRNNRVTDGIDNILLQLATGVTLECNEVYRTSSFKQNWTVRHGLYAQQGGSVVMRNNYLHDLSFGIRMYSMQKVTIGVNNFCHNSTDISGDCSGCSIDKGTQCAKPADPPPASPDASVPKPSADAGVPKPKADATPAPTPTPTQGSCQDLYGKAAGFRLCQESTSSCRFNVKTGGKSCSDVCKSFGGSCLGAFDNPDGAGNECNVIGTDTCSTVRSTELCVCSRPSAPTPTPTPAKKSCQSIYGTVSGYLLCQETADTCRFNATTGGQTCAAVCKAKGGACVGAFDNADGAGKECIALSTPDTCNTARSTEICLCSRF